MSDAPPPPPVGSTPLPPPPAPGLMAPPGYVGYDSGPMSSVSLKRTAGVERAATILVVAAAALALGGVVAGRAVIDDADAYLAGQTDQDRFIESITPYLLLTFVQSLAVVGSAVMVVIWMYRIAGNHDALHRGATWGKGWAIGGWFLPPMLYVIPFLMFRELWKASDPEVPVGGDWRAGSASPLITVWFVLYSIVPLVLLGFQTGDLTSAFSASETELAEQITASPVVGIIGVAAAAAAAAVFVVMARGLGRRHRALTGEDRV